MKQRIAKLKGGLIKENEGYYMYFGSQRGPFGRSVIPLTENLALRRLNAEVEQAKMQFGDEWKMEFIREDLDFEKNDANQN